ncbi:MAG: THUMP domain-containing protein [Candidatus Thorarchaeota archaeon]
MQEFSGLLISSARTLERNSSSEMFYLLSEILGYENVDVNPVPDISGLSIATFSENPISTLEKIKTEIEKDNSVLQYSLKLVPIQYRTNSSIEKMEEIMKIFNDYIGEDDTWRITLRRRHSQLSREEIIHSLAEIVTNGSVKLENPDYHIIVEILGKWSYLSLSPISGISVFHYISDQENDNFTF